jgi:hypothetical protein
MLLIISLTMQVGGIIDMQRETRLGSKELWLMSVHLLVCQTSVKHKKKND